MSKFTDYDFFKYAFGEKGKTLSDDQFYKGLTLVAEKLAANKYFANQDVENPLTYMTKVHETLKQWITADYNISELQDYSDFFNKTGEEFYNSKKHERDKVTISSITTNNVVFASSVYPDMIDYYYRSGACLRNSDDKMAHQFDSIINNIDGIEGIGDDTRQFLKRKKANLSAEYPTKEQYKEAYKDFLTAKNSVGLSLDTFKDPMTNGQRDARYLTSKEKTAIAKQLDSGEIQNRIKGAFFRALNMGVLTREEADAVDNPYFSISPYHDAKHAYNRYKGQLKDRGDLLDKENTDEAIRTIIGLKELHANRPWYQKLFYRFGNVGKELDLANRLTRKLVDKGLDAALLNDAVNGNDAAKKRIIASLPTKEERIESQKQIDKAALYSALHLMGPKDPSVHVVYENGVKKLCYMTDEGLDLELSPEDAKYFPGKEAETIFNESVREEIEESFDSIQPVEINLEENVNINQDELANDNFEMNQEELNKIDNEFELEDNKNKEDVVPFESDIEGIAKEEEKELDK